MTFLQEKSDRYYRAFENGIIVKAEALTSAFLLSIDNFAAER